MALVDGLATARAIPSKRLQVLQHGGLVALDHQAVIGLLGNDQFCGFPATVQGVQGQRPPCHIQFLDQLAGGDDLAAGEAAGGHLAVDDTGAVLHSGNQATIRLARCAVRRRRLAVESQYSVQVKIGGFLPLIKSGKESFAAMAGEGCLDSCFRSNGGGGGRDGASLNAIPAKAGIQNQNSKMTKTSQSEFRTLMKPNLTGCLQITPGSL